MMRNRRGFTLIEVVVAISILSLIVLAIVTAMRSLATTQSRLEARAEQASNVLQVSRFLQRNLSSSVAVQIIQMGRFSGYLFGGTQDRLMWVAPLILPGIPGGVSVIRLIKQDDQLLVQVRPGADRPAWNEADPTFVLLNEVESFTVAYRANAYAEWMPSWGEGVNAEMPMPSHVRLRLKVAGRFWPDIIVAIDSGPL